MRIRAHWVEGCSLQGCQEPGSRMLVLALSSPHVPWWFLPSLTVCGDAVRTDTPGSVLPDQISLIRQGLVKPNI